MITMLDLGEAKLRGEVGLTALSFSQLLLIVLSKVLELASSGDGHGGDGGDSEECSECEDNLSHCSSSIEVI